jgi:3-hydroxy-5-methyl-1-naphthoate 3-O-methyltransferase
MSPNPNRIVNMASAFYESALLFAASDLGIFAALAKAEQADGRQLAEELHLDPRGATLLLDGCAALGLLEKEGAMYRNGAEAAAFLVPGKPGDLSGAIRYQRDVYPAWHRLKDLAATGAPVESPELHLGDDEARTRTFVLSMHGKALATAQPVLAKLELGGCKQLLDVGGGPGTYAVAISRAYPEIHCTVLDLPAVTRIADGLIAQQGASDRVRTLSGSYHTTPFPGGNDVILFFGMMHQESPEGILSLLRKAYDAAAPGARIYVMDMMTDASHTAPKFSALFAVNMALTTKSGWVFSAEELMGWMAEAGFAGATVQTLPPPIPHWIVSARKE